MTALIRFLVGSIVLVVWLILGLILYIPLLFRAIAVFSAMIIPASLSNRTKSANAASASLEKAIQFYPYGFTVIFRLLFRSSNENADPEESANGSINIAGAIREIVCAFVFWVTLVLLKRNPDSGG